MKRVFLSIALAVASLSSASCEQLEPPNSASIAVLPAKLLYAAEAAYNIPAHAYVTADSRDQISPALKAQIKPKMEKLGDLLDKARAAHALGNLIDFNARKADLEKLAREISALIP